MKGKVLSIITAILFGATMVASPIVFAAGSDTGAGMEQKAQAKKKTSKKKKTTKKRLQRRQRRQPTRKRKHPLKKKSSSFGKQYAASLRDCRKSGLGKTCHSILDRGQVLFFIAVARGSIRSQPKKPGTMDSSGKPIAEGCILVGPLFNEPVRVETVRSTGDGVWILQLVGAQSGRFRNDTPTARDLESLTE